MSIGVTVNDLTCPIYKLIFNDPVVADDGFIYERDAITNWFTNNNISPMMAKPISKKLVSCNFIKQLVNKYLEEYPEEKENQYMMTEDYYDNIFTIRQILKNHLYSNLLNFINFDIENMFDGIFEDEDEEEGEEEDKQINLFFDFIQNCKDINIIKHVLDKSITLECSNDGGWKPIHYVCRYVDKSIYTELVKYLIDKNIDLECETGINKWRPVHLICRYGDDNIIEHIINKNVYLECETKNGWKPIHHVCRYANFSSIKLLIDKQVDLKGKIKRLNNEKCNYGLIDIISLNKKITSEQKEELKICFSSQ